ncbi:MAG: primosomal protein N', partial [Duncaniella sp.]|nr:primosomal protein N' [Duncaniella sp.]
MLTQPMYAEVLLPVPIRGTFTYEVPAQMQGVISQGHRVIVPFGLRKSYTGIVQGFSLRRPEGFDVKKIEMLLDDGPIVRHPQMRFWQWLADYYLCTPGEVYRAAVPSGLKLESETFVSPVK